MAKADNTNKRKRGRPDKLTPEALLAAQKYYEKKKLRRECPFVEELAVYELDVDHHTVANWCKKYKDKVWLRNQHYDKRRLYTDFFATIKKMATMQLLYLKIKGLKDKRNAVAIFLMKANHGLVETSRHEHTGRDGTPIEYKQIEVANV